MSSQINLTLFDKAVLDGNATWWQMELPSGEVTFGEQKALMLGYSPDKFAHYQDFTKLLHPADEPKAMQAMRDHFSGEKDAYETSYRIKHAQGHYVQFYDFGQVIKRVEDNMTVIGFVMRFQVDEDPIEQMKGFREMIVSGDKSLIDLVKEMGGDSF